MDFNRLKKEEEEGKKGKNNNSTTKEKTEKNNNPAMAVGDRHCQTLSVSFCDEHLDRAIVYTDYFQPRVNLWACSVLHLNLNFMCGPVSHVYNISFCLPSVACKLTLHPGDGLVYSF